MIVADYPCQPNHKFLCIALLPWAHAICYLLLDYPPWYPSAHVLSSRSKTMKISLSRNVTTLLSFQYKTVMLSWWRVCENPRTNFFAFFKCSLWLLGIWAVLPSCVAIICVRQSCHESFTSFKVGKPLSLTINLPESFSPAVNWSAVSYLFPFCGCA